MSGIGVVKASVLTLSALMLASCSWVEIAPNGESVRVITAKQAAICKKVGKVTVSLKDKIAGIERSREKVRTELETLARNNAAEMNGNAIIPADESLDGKQTFSVYRCP